MRRDLIAFYVEDQIISILVQPINWFSRKTRGEGIHVLARMVARTCGDGCTYLREKRQCTAGTDAVHCNRSRSALQPPLQCTASARTYLVYFKRKYMRPPRITFATADANVINRSSKRYKPLPQTFAGKGAHLGIPSPMVFL